MQKTVLSITLLASLFSVAAEANSMPDPYAEPAAAIQARQGVHRLMGASLMDAGAIATGKKPWNGFTMLNRVDSLAGLSIMYNDFFFVFDSFTESKASDDLLERKEEFQSRSKALKNATLGLRLAVRNHDGNSSMKAVVTTIQACNACHQSFMKPDARLILPLPDAPGGH
ncbi:cytochrome c [Shewanella canadensis]|uniref:Cytochrome c n=1 Tax=Shewanella canadensis TaxID=271096 RepID=A0A431WKL3_9GAMM|nr:cytochrome c [Shewanella canadensis]RTR35936.1 cytochrome c [Shewanella canadensis]